MTQHRLLKFKATTTQVKKRPSIKCCLRSYTPRVSNQKGEGVCVSLAVTDMVETTLKIHDKTVPRDLVLSPQSLIDSRLWVNELLIDNFCCDSDYGLESIKTYPYLRMEGTFEEEKLKAYKDRKFEVPKYWLERITRVEKEDIEDVILKNFSGPQFPLVGVMKMGLFAHHKVATSFAVDSKNNLPYRPGAFIKKSLTRNLKLEEGEEDDHALLIVGLDTTHEDPQYHFCWVKNSYGKKWGIRGFSRVGLEVFEYLYVPEYNHAAVNELREKEEEEEKRRKLQAKLKKISPSVLAQPPVTKMPEPQLKNSQNLSDMAYGESSHLMDDKVGKMDLDLEVDENELMKCFLVRHLPMFIRFETVKDYFSRYGKVKGVCFLSLGNKFKRSCIVKMKSAEEATSIIEMPPDLIGLADHLTIETYHGMSHHQHIYEQGQFQILVEGVGLNRTDEEICAYMETLLTDSQYSTIELLRKSYTFTGGLKLRFLTEKKMKQAIIKCRNSRLKVKILKRIPSPRKRKTQKRKRT